MIFLGDGDLVLILEDLEKMPSTNSKIHILSVYKDRQDLQAYLDIALNPNRIYHIKKLPTKTSKSNSLNQATLKDIYSLGGLAKYLESKRGLCGDDLDVVYFYFKELHSPLYVKWAEKAILKKAIAGVGVKTVNKAFGYKFLPEHNIMLMNEWKEPLENLRYPVYVQRKLDGFRCTYIPNLGFVGRKGLPIANVNLPAHLNMGNTLATKKNIFNMLNFVFDGEVYSHKRNFNEIASILSSVDKPIPEDVKFYIFNAISKNGWDMQKCSDTYTDQLQLFAFIRDQGIHERIEFMQTFICDNPKDLQELYQSFLAEGYEGAIVRSLDFSYCWKRATAKSQTIMKLKPKDHIDVKIIGCFEGQGNMTGMLGGFHIELENGKQLKVGSGFKEWERIEFWNQRGELIGEWIRLQYTEETPDGSLRFPVFDAKRDPKE
jgi:DNA ligase-1